MSLLDGVATEVRYPGGLAADEFETSEQPEQPNVTSWPAGSSQSLFGDAGVEGAAEAPLGNTTVLASTSINSASRVLGKKKRQSKAVRIDHGTIVRHQFELLDFLNDRLPDPGQVFDDDLGKWVKNPGDRWRVRSCARIPIMRGNVQLMRSKQGRVYYRGVNRCGSVWTCPVCSSRVAAFRRKELSLAVSTKDCWVALSTYTLRHNKQDSLRYLTRTLKTAIRSMRSGRGWADIVARYGLVGSYSSMEFTWSSDNGWHPHMHMLDVFAEVLSWQDQVTYQDLVRRRWLHALEAATGHVIGAKDAEWQHGYTFRGALSDNDALVQAYYAVKWGSSEEQWTDLMKRKAGRASSSHVVSEVTGAMTKQGRVLEGVHYSMWELLDLAQEGSDEAWRLWFEFAQVTKNLHQGSWSRGLRDWLGIGAEVADEDVPEDEDATEMVVDIENHDWWRVCFAKRRGILLQLAARGATMDELEHYIRYVARLQLGYGG